jgi:hypothetical protein
MFTAILSLARDNLSALGYSRVVKGFGPPVCGREQHVLPPKGKSPEISQAKEP